MNTFSPDIIERLGWVLIHSLWQFGVIAIFAAVIVSILRRRPSVTRYGVLVVAMTLMVITSCVTWILISASPTASASGYDIDASLYREADAVPLADLSASALVSPVASTSGYDESAPLYREADAVPLADESLAESLQRELRLWFSWIVGGWLIGVFVCSFRPLLGWRTLHRLPRIGISPPSDEVLAAFALVSQRLSLRRPVQVFHSTMATGPLVVGYLKPVVLLPVSLVTSIPMPQLEAILAHELAHIRRHDFVINLAQTLMETLFFYHPAIWWLSHRIRIEREHCCDDLVVKLFDNGVEYGRALLAIEQLQSQRTTLVLGATDGSLLARIRRITGRQSYQPRCFPFIAAAIALAVTCGIWIAGHELIYGASNDQVKNPDAIAAFTTDDSAPLEIGEPEVLTIRKDETQTVKSKSRIRRVEGFSDEVVSIPKLQTPNQFEVLGKSVGLTSLTLTDEHGDVYLIAVEVVDDDARNPVPADRIFQITSAHLLPTYLSDDQSKLTLVVGGAIEFEFPWLVRDTKESDKGIIKVDIVKQKHKLAVQGISPGNTTLSVFNASLTDRQERLIEVEVLRLTRENILAVFGKSEKIEAKLLNGMTVELLGISTPPIGSPLNDKREWWKGDGTEMEAAPIDMGSIHGGASKIDGREFVFRASNLAGQLPIDVRLKDRFKDSQPYQPEGNGWSQGSTHSGPMDANQKDKWQVTSEYVAGPIGDADSATLEVRVGSGVTAEMLFDTKGVRSNDDSKDDVWELAAVKKMAERFEVLRTGPHESGFAIWTKPFSSTTDEGTLNIALIDVTGELHYPFTSGSDGNEAFNAFQIKPDDIDKFVVRLQPYQYVATFENVSLKPGKKSGVKASVEPLAQPPKPIQAALPSGGSWQLLGMTQTQIDSTVTSDRSWWNGDGSLLLSPPVPGNELKLKADRPDGRLFLFRLSGRAAFYSPDIKLQFLKNEMPVKLRDGQKVWSESRTTLNPTTRDSVMEFAAGPVGDADSVILDLRFTSDQKGVDTYDRSSDHANDIGYGVPLLNAAVNRMFRSVHVLRAGPHNDSFAVWTKPFDSKSEDGQVMLEVQDGRSSILTSDSQPDGSEQRYSPKVKPEDVQSFAFQFYLYDTRIRIQNMALNAGVHTEPKVLVDPIAWDTIGEQEARDTLSEMYHDSIEFVPAPDGLLDLHVRNLPTAGWQFFSLLTHLRAIEIRGGNLRHGSLRHLAQIPGLKSLTIAGARCLPEDLQGSCPFCVRLSFTVFAVP